MIYRISIYVLLTQGHVFTNIMFMTLEKYLTNLKDWLDGLGCKMDDLHDKNRVSYYKYIELDFFLGAICSLRFIVLLRLFFSTLRFLIPVVWEWLF
jgi:hypothetical protein